MAGNDHQSLFAPRAERGKSIPFTPHARLLTKGAFQGKLNKYHSLSCWKKMIEILFTFIFDLRPFNF